MDDAALVRRGESLRDLMRPVDRAADGEARLLQPLAQRRSFEQLHHRVRDAVLAAEIVNGEDVRMGERGDRSRLALETRQRLRLVRHHVGDDFDRDVAAQALIVRAPDLAHATRADRRDDFIRTDARAGLDHPST
jgi:hypothetical protein